MSDFTFLQNPLSKKWVISAPRRAKRPDIARGVEPVCPFCVGREKDEPEVYRIQRTENREQKTEKGRQKTEDTDGIVSPSSVLHNPSSNICPPSSDWLVRVVNNKFPFAPIHEVIINSPDHHKSFGEFPLEHAATILTVYRQRYQTHQEKGQVYLFHNRGKGGGESLPHSHTQLAVITPEMTSEIPRLDPGASAQSSPQPLRLQNASVIQLSGISFQFSVNGSSVSQSTGQQTTDRLQTENRQPKTDNREESVIQQESTSVETNHFYLFCPATSQWPDEVWVAPKMRGRAYGEITDDEIADLAFVLTRLIQILDLRHGNEFPFNFYIYPGGDWYLRLIPRQKTLGGFEVGTGIFVNTQDPVETITFLQEHFHTPDVVKILREHQAEYHRGV